MAALAHWLLTMRAFKQAGFHRPIHWLQVDVQVLSRRPSSCMHPFGSLADADTMCFSTRRSSPRRQIAFQLVSSCHHSPAVTQRLTDCMGTSVRRRSEGITTRLHVDSARSKWLAGKHVPLLEIHSPHLETPHSSISPSPCVSQKYFSAFRAEGVLCLFLFTC